MIGSLLLMAALVAPPSATSLGEATAQAAASPAPADARVRELQKEIERLRTELRGLTGDIEKLRVGGDPSAAAELAARVAAVEARQARLEAELVRVAEELRQAGDALDQVSEGDRKRPTLTVYGTLQGNKYQGRNSVLDAEAFELVLSGRPHPRLSFFAEIEFERAATVGGPRGGEVVLEQAYVSYTFAQAFAIRTGVLLVPFGNVNVDHFAPLRDVVRKPLVSYAIAPSDWTDNGLEITGRRLMGTAWLIEYEAALIAGLDDQISSVGTRAARQPFGVDNNGNKAVVGRLALKRSASFETGVSGYRGRYDDGGRLSLTGWAADLRTELGPLRLTGEFDRFTAGQVDAAPRELLGYYVRASLDLKGALLRKIAKDFEEPRLTLVAQYDWARIEGPGATAGSVAVNRETGVTLGIAYRPSRQWVLKIDHETNRATQKALDRGTVNGWLGSVGFVF
jgi:hypothetical protein